MEPYLLALIDDVDLRDRLEARLALRDFSAWSAERMTTKIGGVYAAIAAGAQA
jgi:hypothetical protein